MTESSSKRVPDRLKWAVEVLALQPHDRILEIGCGRGVAMSLICQHLLSGHIVGIDRSAKAIAAAEATSSPQIEVGKARIIQASLAETALQERFDKVFAVNVTVFWRGPRQELTVVRKLLVPGGRLYLFYEPPSLVQLERAVKACTEFLENGGYAVFDVRHKRLSCNHGVCIVAEPRTA